MEKARDERKLLDEVWRMIDVREENMRKWKGRRGIGLFIGSKEGDWSNTNQPGRAMWQSFEEQNDATNKPLRLSHVSASRTSNHKPPQKCHVENSLANEKSPPVK